MEAATVASAAPARAERCSPAVLKLAPDEVLVERVRAGSEEAFTALYERHYRSILSYCRHMLRAHEEGEDAVQQTFINAHRGMLSGDKELNFRPWLYRIARNHCISILRARRPVVEVSEEQPSLVGLAQEVGSRSDLREMLRDLASLPDEQREALILTELHDNSHIEVADIIGCDKEKVKSLVFQARSSLIKSKEAREVSCEDIRGQLSVLRGGSLRRSLIKRHITECDGCRAFDQDVKRQRQAMALILPVIPSSALKGGAATAMAASGMNGFSGAGTTGLAVGGSVGPPASVASVASVASFSSAASTASVASAGGAGVGSIVSSSVTSIAGKLGVSALLVKGAVATVAVSAVVAGGVGGVGVVRQAAERISGNTPGKSAEAPYGRGGSAQGLERGNQGRSEEAAAKRGGGERAGRKGRDPAAPPGARGKQGAGKQGAGRQETGRPAVPGANGRENAPGRPASPGDRAATGRPENPGNSAAPKSGGASPPTRVIPTPGAKPTPKTPPAYGPPESTPSPPTPPKSKAQPPVLPSAVPLDAAAHQAPAPAQ